MRKAEEFNSVIPRFATIWRMMLEPARLHRSWRPRDGESTSQFSLLCRQWLHNWEFALR